MQTPGINQIRAEGMKALMERLGAYGTLRFLDQFDIGYGDYTKERKQWEENTTVDEIAEEIFEKRKKYEEEKY